MSATRVSLYPREVSGAGETVELTGNLHEVVTATEDGNGGTHTQDHHNPQGVSGVGTDTGDLYQGTGVTRQSINVQHGSEMTYVNNFRIIGQGPGNNYMVHEVFHMTTNAIGDTTADVTTFSEQCK